MSVELANHITAAREALKADPDGVLATAMGGTIRVHGAEIPDSRVPAMPERCAVVRAAGGPGVAPGTSDNAPITVYRIDVLCYGRTPAEADLVALSVKHALKRWRYGQTSGRHAHVSGLAHAAPPGAAPTSAADAPTRARTLGRAGGPADGPRGEPAGGAETSLPRPATTP